MGLVSYETINNPKYNESYIGYIAAETAEKIGLPSAVYKVRYTQYARPAEAHGSLEVCVVNGTLHGQWFHNHASSGSWVGWDRFISNSDFEVKGYNVTTVVNTSKEIVGAPTTSDYVPVIVGATQTKAHQTTITFDSGKWYAYSNVAQVLSIRFYKLPTV